MNYINIPQGRNEHCAKYGTKNSSVWMDTDRYYRKQVLTSLCKSTHAESVYGMYA